VPDAPTAPRLKVCGVTSRDDALHAVEAGAWAVGMVLWPGSERACPLPEAERIGRALRRRAEVAGAFVNPTLDEVAAVAEGVGLTLVQLHGDEGPAFCAEVARRTGARVIKARRIRGRSDVAALEPFHTDFHLADAYVAPDRYGGTGQTFEWSLLRHRQSSVRLILSGGLTSENVGDAIAAVRPFAVDVASGTEARPGVKDPARVEAFAAAVRAAGERLAAGVA
jgi:phosphoribosylanthranilate isomerase